MSALFLVYGFMAAKTASAQTFSLNPSSATKKVGEEFTVDLNIDTAGKQVAGADVKITFDSAAIEVVRVSEGTFFTDEAHNIGSGTLYVAGFFAEQFKTESGTGKIAIITLKGKTTGTAQLTFVCTTATNDCNILDGSANDIINCSGIRNGSYIISEADGSSSPTATPTPTPTGGTAATATPTPPVSGIALPTFFSLGLGMFLTILGFAFIL